MVKSKLKRGETVKSLGNRIKEARKSAGLKQSDIAKLLKIKNTTVSNWEKDISKPDIDTIEFLCGLFNVSANYFISDMASKEVLSFSEKEHMKKYRDLDEHGKDIINTILDKEYEYQKSLERQSLKDIPNETEHAYIVENNRLYKALYDYGVSAGIGNYLDEWNVPKSIVEVEDTPTARKADYILKVDGESMMPTYADGDRVFVKAQETVNMNEMGIFIIDGKCFLKQFKGDHLHSLNQDYEDIPFVEEQNIKCVGKVLGKV